MLSLTSWKRLTVSGIRCELHHVHRRLQLGHAVVGAAEQLALVARRRKALRPPQPAALGQPVGALPQPLLVGDEQAALAAADDLVGRDAEAAQVAERCRRSCPWYLPPQDWAQSSTTFRLCLRATSMIASMSHTLPITCVGAMATVRGVISASIFVGSMCSDSSTSQKTGTPLDCTTAAAVAKKPMAGQITSVPGPTPAATNAECSAAVPELTPMAYLTPKISRATRSKACTLVSGRFE